MSRNHEVWEVYCPHCLRKFESGALAIAHVKLEEHLAERAKSEDGKCPKS